MPSRSKPKTKYKRLPIDDQVEMTDLDEPQSGPSHTRSQTLPPPSYEYAMSANSTGPSPSTHILWDHDTRAPQLGFGRTPCSCGSIHDLESGIGCEADVQAHPRDNETGAEPYSHPIPDSRNGVCAYATRNFAPIALTAVLAYSGVALVAATVADNARRQSKESAAASTSVSMSTPTATETATATSFGKDMTQVGPGGAQFESSEAEEDTIVITTDPTPTAWKG